MRQRSAFIDNFFSELIDTVAQSKRNTKLNRDNEWFEHDIAQRCYKLNIDVCLTCESIHERPYDEKYNQRYDKPTLINVCRVCCEDMCDDCGGIEYCITCNAKYHAFCANKHKKECKRKKRRK